MGHPPLEKTALAFFVLIAWVYERTAKSGPRGAGRAGNLEFARLCVRKTRLDVRAVLEVSAMEGQEKKAKDWRKCKEFRGVREEILESLGGKDKLDAITRSRVDEYLDFWVMRHQLQDDVNSRGLYVEDDRGRMTENRSVSLSIQASRQMAAIASALGLVVGAERRMEDEEL